MGERTTGTTPVRRCGAERKRGREAKRRGRERGREKRESERVRESQRERERVRESQRERERDLCQGHPKCVSNPQIYCGFA